MRNGVCACCIYMYVCMSARAASGGAGAGPPHGAPGARVCRAGGEGRPGEGLRAGGIL